LIPEDNVNEILENPNNHKSIQLNTQEFGTQVNVSKIPETTTKD